MPETEDSKGEEELESRSVGQLCTFIEISTSQLEYWRRTLDPNKKRRKFFDCDVYFYLILKKAITIHFYPVAQLVQLDWDFVLKACTDIHEDELINCSFVIDPVDAKILLLGPSDKEPSPRAVGELKRIPMNEQFNYLDRRRNRNRPPKNRNVISLAEFKRAQNPMESTG